MNLKGMFAKVKRSVLPEGGRSSVNSKMDGMLSSLTEFYNVKLNECLPVLEKLSIYNPDVSHAIRNWINMANTGHTIILEGRNAEKALDELNKKAATLYRNSFGIDGLVNEYIKQIAVTGAISSEDVLNEDFSGLQEIVLVPTKQIRFDVKNNWQAYQFVNGKRYDLNRFTYKYIAHTRLNEEEPFAKPLIISVLEPAARQKDMHENLNYLVKKFGLLGFISYELTPPPRNRKNQETEAEYQKRLRQHLGKYSNALSESYKDGILVHYNDQKVNYQNLGAMSKGSEDLHKLNEEQMFSGIGIDPAMQGRSYSTTETYAGVVYNLTANEARTLQRMVKRRLEHSYRLQLQLAGYDVDVKIQFNDVPQKDPKEDAERDKIKYDTTKAKVQDGLISPETGAQELGYDSWYDEKKLIASYDANDNEYLLQKLNKTYLMGSGEKRRPFNNLAKEEEQLAGYLKGIRPFLDKAQKASLDEVSAMIESSSFTDFDDAADFADRALEKIKEGHNLLKDNKELQEQVSGFCQGMYEASRFTQTDKKYTGLDGRIVKFLSGTDNFFLSSYVNNNDFGKPMLQFLSDQYQEYGANLWDRMNPKAIADFRNAFTNQLIDLTDFQVKRIIDTSVMTARNMGELSQFVELGIEKTEVYEAMEELACPICLEFHGKVVETKYVKEHLTTISGMDPDGYLEHLKAKSELFKDMKNNVRGQSMGKLVSSGVGLPSYHPHCKGRVIKHREVETSIDGQKVNTAEAGSKIDFINPKTEQQSRQTIKYSMVDKFGQKVLMTEEGYKHIGNHHQDALGKVAGTVRSAKMFGTDKNYSDIMGYVGDSGYFATVYQNNGNVVWTAFKPRNAKKYFNNRYGVRR